MKIKIKQAGGSVLEVEVEATTTVSQSYLDSPVERENQRREKSGSRPTKAHSQRQNVREHKNPRRL